MAVRNMRSCSNTHSTTLVAGWSPIVTTSIFSTWLKSEACRTTSLWNISKRLEWKATRIKSCRNTSTRLSSIRLFSQQQHKRVFRVCLTQLLQRFLVLSSYKRITTFERCCWHPWETSSGQNQYLLVYRCCWRFGWTALNGWGRHVDVLSGRAGLGDIFQRRCCCCCRW